HAQDACADADTVCLQGDFGEEHGDVVGPRLGHEEGIVAETIRHTGNGDQHVAPSLQRHHGHGDPVAAHGSYPSRTLAKTGGLRARETREAEAKKANRSATSVSGSWVHVLDCYRPLT